MGYYKTMSMKTTKCTYLSLQALQSATSLLPALLLDHSVYQLPARLLRLGRFSSVVYRLLPSRCYMLAYELVENLVAS